MASLSFVPLSMVTDNMRSARQAASASPPIIFGREAVFIDAEAPAPETMARLPLVKRELGAGMVLTAIVQKGRLFEQAHPDVTVLRNRGRFLLVELPPEHPLLSEAPAEPCYAAYRVDPGAEVFRDLGPADLKARRDPAVEAVLDRLSIVTFRQTLEELVALRTRLSTSDLYGDAARICHGRLEALGYTVTLQEFDMEGGRSCNVLAMPPGAGPIAALVVGHLDSVNHVDGPGGDAPGADDNGSGSAGVIAMAEALSEVRDRIPVGFVLFGGEEQGLLGSTHFLSQMQEGERSALKAVINMDMIASLNTPAGGGAPAPGVLIEGAEVSRGLVENLVLQAASYTDLTVQTSFNPFASDHVPFIRAGLPAVLTIEGADQSNDRIHGPNDTLQHIDDGLAYRILRMNCALMASLAGSPAGSEEH